MCRTDQSNVTLLAGVVPLLTGTFGYCPLYALLGFDTCPLAKKPS